MNILMQSSRPFTVFAHRLHAGGGVYSPTVRLPTTTFSLRANAVVREPEIQKFWSEAAVYEKLLESNTGVRVGSCIVCGERHTIVAISFTFGAQFACL